MVKKPKLSDALASYTKKQTERAKEQKRHEAIEVMNKNKAKKTSPAAQGSSEPQTSKTIINDHVPCHIWTDADKMQQRTRLPFHPKNNSVILLIGEGDFSYCRALVTTFLEAEKRLTAEEGVTRKWRVVATALDSREAVLRKYRKARDNLVVLEENENVEIVFGVDGTKLHENRELKRIFGTNDRPPTRVIFNFPHTGAGIKDRERNIVAQQKMLQGFFESILKFVKLRGITPGGCAYTTTMIKKDYTIKEEVLTLKRKLSKSSGKGKKDSDAEESDGDIVITDAELLANNAKIIKENEEMAYFDEKEKGESFEIHCTFKTGDPYDAWKPKALVTRTGQLVCLQTFKFCPELYPGYQHCRTIGDKGDEIVEVDGWKEFLAGKPAKTFVFSLKK
jgi:25S rRNA (uracil2634-N3)-methyltransferase